MPIKLRLSLAIKKKITAYHKLKLKLHYLPDLDVLLGQGAFGKVMKAYATDINGVPGRTAVAVKMVRGRFEGSGNVILRCLLDDFLVQ